MQYSSILVARHPCLYFEANTEAAKLVKPIMNLSHNALYVECQEAGMEL